MLGNIQAMLLIGWRLCKLYESGKMTPGHASLGKAWTSRKAREVVSLGRELLGGNAILADFLVAKLKVLQFRLQSVRAAKAAMKSRVLLLVLWSLAMVVVALLWEGGQADAYYYYVPTLAVRCHPQQPPAPRVRRALCGAVLGYGVL
ncbi:unnamed protein product [Urochloa humidicola]